MSKNMNMNFDGLYLSPPLRTFTVYAPEKVVEAAKDVRISSIGVSFKPYTINSFKGGEWFFFGG